MRPKFFYCSFTAGIFYLFSHLKTEAAREIISGSFDSVSEANNSNVNPLEDPFNRKSDIFKGNEVDDLSSIMH